MKEFNKQNILKEQSFKLDEIFTAIEDGAKICAFIRDISPTEYHRKDNITGEQILDNWRNYFTKRDIPFAISHINGYFTLWKIDERLDNNAVRKEQKNQNVRWFVEKN